MNKGDETYQRLIHPVEGQLIRTVWRILRDPDDADDALQSALETIWKRLPTIAKHPNPQALILRIAVNAAYDQLRKRIRQEERRDLDAIPEELPAANPHPAQNLAQKQNLELIFKAIAQLSRNQAEAILMRLVQEQPYPHIAEALGCSEATARSHVRRGRARLEELLSKLNPGQFLEVLP